jgi:hypothetical protein
MRELVGVSGRGVEKPREATLTVFFTSCHPAEVVPRTLGNVCFFVPCIVVQLYDVNQ